MNNGQLIRFVQRAVQTKSYSNEEEAMAYLVLSEMKKLNYDEALIDSAGNVIGRIGKGPMVIQFDSHMDTVRIPDPNDWKFPPLSGEIAEGYLWGRGSVDMKSALCASVYAAAFARNNNFIKGKTLYVTGTVCEENCDGESLKHLYKELHLSPDYCIICEPSNNIITLGHKGKAQISLTSHGVSSHGSAPEKGVNAVYEMAEIISRVETLNKSLYKENEPHGTIVLSDISCTSASLNAVPSDCSIYLDRRLAFGETIDGVTNEMMSLIKGKNASWEVGTLLQTTWTGTQLVYEPMHAPWKIDEDHVLTKAMIKAYHNVYDHDPELFGFWDFSTNAVTPVSMGIPCIGFGPGEYQLAHMKNERCLIKQIEEACQVYCQLIKEL